MIFVVIPASCRFNLHGHHDNKYKANYLNKVIFSRKLSYSLFSVGCRGHLNGPSTSAAKKTADVDSSQQSAVSVGRQSWPYYQGPPTGRFRCSMQWRCAANICFCTVGIFEFGLFAIADAGTTIPTARSVERLTLLSAAVVAAANLLSEQQRRTPGRPHCKKYPYIHEYFVAIFVCPDSIIPSIYGYKRVRNRFR